MPHNMPLPHNYNRHLIKVFKNKYKLITIGNWVSILLSVLVPLSTSFYTALLMDKWTEKKSFFSAIGELSSWNILLLFIVIFLFVQIVITFGINSSLSSLNNTEIASKNKSLEEFIQYHLDFLQKGTPRALVLIHITNDHFVSLLSIGHPQQPAGIKYSSTFGEGDACFKYKWYKAFESGKAVVERLTDSEKQASKWKDITTVIAASFLLPGNVKGVLSMDTNVFVENEDEMKILLQKTADFLTEILGA